MNRPVTVEAYGRRLQRVADHIWTHLDEPLDLARLARIACFSPYHFHRVYRATMGETVTETVVRLRLQRAARELAHATHPIAEVARRAGYGSPAAFSRAFRASYGRTPSAFRADRPPCARLALAQAAPPGPPPLGVEVHDRPPMRLATVPHLGPPQTIGHAFDRLMAWGGPRGLTLPPHWGVAVYLSDMATTPPEGRRALAGLTVGPEVEGDEVVSLYHVPGGRHAHLLHKGPFAHLGRAYDRLFAWLADSGEEPADRPLFEVNLNDPRRTAPADLLTQICLPLKSPEAICPPGIGDQGST